MTSSYRFPAGPAAASLLVLVLSSLLPAATLAAFNSSAFFPADHEAYAALTASVLKNQYPSSAFVPSSSDPNLGAALHWRIDGADSSDRDATLHLAVAVQASGWVGFGLSVNGGMTGADLVLVEAQNPTVAKDSYVTSERYPQLDDCQDWTLVNATLQEPYFLVQLSRKLDTGDTQDLVIRNDSDVSIPVSRVIAAWGDDDSVSYHGTNNARGAIRWFSSGELEEDTFRDLMAANADGIAHVGAANHPINDVNRTEYAYYCYSAADIAAQGVNMTDGATIIGISPIINNTRHVHHFILQALFVDLPEGTPRVCSRDVLGMGVITYIWAPGEPPFMLPDNVGFQLGGAEGYQSFVLEVHYDNPDLAEGEFDSSGVDLYYSLEPREHTAGFLVVGDSTVALRGQEIERGLTDYNFECPGTCSALAAAVGDGEPVTVLREYLHMHQSGYSTYVEQIRNGTVVRKGAVEYYDFDQTGGPAPQQDPYQILPGDAFRMKCFYSNQQTSRTFGLGSDEEMCMAFLLYYPRRSFDLGEFQVPWICGIGFADFGLEACDTQWTSQVLESPATLNRTFGTPQETCQAETGDGEGESQGSSGATLAARHTAFGVLLAAAAHFLL